MKQLRVAIVLEASFTHFVAVMAEATHRAKVDRLFPSWMRPERDFWFALSTPDDADTSMNEHVDDHILALGDRLACRLGEPDE